MADKQILEQMLEHLVNDEREKADELFHEYVVTKSREIYESLIEDEMVEEEEKEEDEDEDMEEAASDEDAEEDKVDEEFEDIAIEAGDETDDLEAELSMGDEEGEMGDEEGEDDMGEKEPAELFQDLDAIVDELQAKFDAMKGGEEGDEGEEEMKDGFDPELETVREYVEKVPAAKMGDNGVNTKSIVAGKNDMGGTTANIAKGGESKGEGTKGGLADPNPKEDNAGNINVPGGKAGGAFSTKEPGHGAEKAGAKESADNKQSLFRGRR
jgi:hypothetical protein